MPSWLVTVLIKYALPIILSYLAKTSAAKEVEALALKVGIKSVDTVEGFKTYSAPSDFPSPPPSSTPNNLGG